MNQLVEMLRVAPKLWAIYTEVRDAVADGKVTGSEWLMIEEKAHKALSLILYDLGKGKVLQ